ncbi:Protein kinase domain [Carpediemonas membranifera]|uniref:Protein kinase domain n=1 Tax=Carpediemonas membranifera TaxID=201153 RepID=A0A8J6B0F8_9EUKA|nr:Protein kinase domain [Carpediemonas membranifera]|eukprot:KAG9396650.1 Protein kinase domain [Carpediemonas membranifera]
MRSLVIFAVALWLFVNVSAVASSDAVGTWKLAPDRNISPPDGMKFGAMASDGKLLVLAISDPSSTSDRLAIFSAATSEPSKLCANVAPGKIYSLAMTSDAVAVVHSTASISRAVTVYRLSTSCPVLFHNEPGSTRSMVWGDTVAMDEYFLAVGSSSSQNEEAFITLYYDTTRAYQFTRNFQDYVQQTYYEGVQDLVLRSKPVAVGREATVLMSVSNMNDPNNFGIIMFNFTGNNDHSVHPDDVALTNPDNLNSRWGASISIAADGRVAVGAPALDARVDMYESMDDLLDGVVAVRLSNDSAPHVGDVVDLYDGVVVALDSTSDEQSLSTFLTDGSGVSAVMPLAVGTVTPLLLRWIDGATVAVGNSTALSVFTLECGAGYGTASAPGQLCQLCDNGRYRASSPTCVPAPAGYVVPADGKPHTAPMPCNTGKYQAKTGQAECDSCPLGKGTPGGAEGFAQCWTVVPLESKGAMLYFNSSATMGREAGASFNHTRCLEADAGHGVTLLVPVVGQDSLGANKELDVTVNVDRGLEPSYDCKYLTTKSFDFKPTQPATLDKGVLSYSVISPVCPGEVRFPGAELFPLMTWAAEYAGSMAAVRCLSNTTATAAALKAFTPTLPETYTVASTLCVPFEDLVVKSAAGFHVTLGGQNFSPYAHESELCIDVDPLGSLGDEVTLDIRFDSVRVVTGQVKRSGQTPGNGTPDSFPYVVLAAPAAILVILAVLAVLLCCLCCCTATGLGLGRRQLRRKTQSKLRTKAKGELMKIGADVQNDLYRSIIDFYIPPSAVTEVHTIASGGFGTVSVAAYGAGIVCLKRLHPMLQADPQSMDEFAREALHMVSLRHRSVVPFLGATIIDGVVHLLTEYCPFGSLDKYVAKMKSDGTYSHAKLVDLLIDCGEGLAFIHSRGVIHRDIKPDNFFVGVLTHNKQSTKANSVVGKIGDFGLAVSKKAMTMTNIGTVGYSSPEVLAGKSYAASTDVFSFGMTLFALFSGQQPFEEEGSSFVVQSRMLKGDRPALTGVPGPIADIIKRCWAHEAEARPTMDQTVKSLRRARRDLAHQGGYQML